MQKVTPDVYIKILRLTLFRRVAEMYVLNQK